MIRIRRIITDKNPLKSVASVSSVCYFFFINSNLGYIIKYGHLPGIPSAKEIQENGNIYDLGKMVENLLIKVEEQTRYTIAQDEQIEALKAEINSGADKGMGWFFYLFLLACLGLVSYLFIRKTNFFKEKVKVWGK